MEYGFIDQLFSLDDNKNVNIQDLENRSRLCQVISALKPVRDVDWSKSRDILSCNMQAIAAHGQRCGDVLAPKDACLSCKAGYGAFKSCVVLSFEGRTRSYIQGGCCMNCYFTRARSYKCSLWGDRMKLKPGKKENDDAGSTVGPSHDPLEYLQAKKRKRTLEYDSTYYQSPLDRPDIKGKGRFGEKRQALESIHSVYDRVVQDMNRLFNSLSKANQLESGEDTEEDEKGPVVVGSDIDEEDTKEIAVEAVVKVEEIEKKDVKIAESGSKKEEEEEKPATSKKSSGGRGKGKKAVDVEEK
ncbi:Protein of unknown function DUF3716 [Penicillium camemberti]|uniref:Uncharacterized protein n=1 Tax=Penicillium camemberti (strain FM 013) TaxID=1429867 RepID=A0A0G4PDT1_PENC3|nr:Protein of unknown function DUF3716 [Penicillium camemberti]